jgi:uncharacterized membrane protein (UPF0127 family)
MTQEIIRQILAIALAAGLFGVKGCERKPAAQPAQPQPQAQAQHVPNLPTVTMQVGNRQYTLEIAADDDTRARGLMYRDSMPADRGMIFSFPDEEPRSFWMRNTRIPLDIIYLDRNGKIVSIKPMKPFDLTGVESNRPAKYAIELNHGHAAAAGLREGDVIQLPQNMVKAAR